MPIWVNVSKLSPEAAVEEFLSGILSCANMKEKQLPPSRELKLFY